MAAHANSQKLVKPGCLSHSCFPAYQRSAHNAFDSPNATVLACAVGVSPSSLSPLPSSVLAALMSAGAIRQW
jgi:hypothetical protein